VSPSLYSGRVPGGPPCRDGQRSRTQLGAPVEITDVFLFPPPSLIRSNETCPPMGIGRRSSRLAFSISFPLSPSGSFEDPRGKYCRPDHLVRPHPGQPPRVAPLRAFPTYRAPRLALEGRPTWLPSLLLWLVCTSLGDDTRHPLSPQVFSPFCSLPERSSVPSGKFFD